MKKKGKKIRRKEMELRNHAREERRITKERCRVIYRRERRKKETKRITKIAKIIIKK